MTAEHEARDMPKLFALYGEWRRLERVAISGGDEADDWRTAFEAEDRFYDMPARSAAGVLFKLRVACLDELVEKDKPLPAIMRDLERMAGNVSVPHPG